MENKIVQGISQKIQDVASFFKGEQRSSIQRITDIAVTDELLMSYARRYAYGIRNDVRYHESLDAHDLLGTFDRNIDNKEFYQYHDIGETEICERTYARYCEAADRRLPVYMFLDELKRSKNVQMYSMSDSPVTMKQHFCFAKDGVRYKCNIESSYSVVEGGENTCEVTVSSGGNEVKKRFPLQSFLDDPITILEFAEFLYGQEDGWHKRDKVKQKIGSFSFNGIYGKLKELLKSAMQEQEVSALRMMLAEEEAVINIYDTVKKEVEDEKEGRKPRTELLQERIKAKVSGVTVGDRKPEVDRIHDEEAIGL